MCIYCLDANTGKEKWVFATEGGNDAFLTSIATGDGTYRIVAPSRDSMVYIINPDGSLYGKTTATQADIDSGAVVLKNGNFVTGGDAGKAWCFTAEGETVWRHNLGTYINSTPRAFSIGDIEYVVVSTMDGTVSILNSENGHEVAQILCNGSVEGTIFVTETPVGAEIVVTTTNGFIELYEVRRG